MEQRHWIQPILELNPELQTKLITSAGIILFLWVFRFVGMRILLRRTDDVRVHYRWGKTLTYITVVFGIILVARVWFEGIQSLATFLGLLSAGIAIALKDLIANIAGWFFIISRRPFDVGDRIQIGENAGDVIDIGVFQFTLLETGNWVDADQSTGRMIQNPNMLVFTQPMANYTKGFAYIWNEIPVLVTFESNWKKAKGILLDIVNNQLEHLDKAVEKQIKQAAKQFMIFYSVLTPTVYTSVKDCGVMLTIRYICEPRKRRGTEQTIWEKILEEFAECEDIDFAYPTQRFYNNPLEGKFETRPSPPVQAEKPLQEKTD